MVLLCNCQLLCDARSLSKVMVILANVLTNVTAALLSAWVDMVPLDTYFNFNEASGFGDFYLNISVIWANETLYDTRIVPAIINVLQWLDDMDANEPTVSVVNPYDTSSFNSISTVVPASEEYKSSIRDVQKMHYLSHKYLAQEGYSKPGPSHYQTEIYSL
ncbi:XXYS1_4_G0050510.mRNA.1.CDS.1 [Saccharomyces cerevisiae]|nr:XXYS1_4_G0050510.mRNA.1.CDS.1 [Saccharomyces cerevisiae]CAD6614694.1 EM14S01-3B_G0047910.mRNA.1.CDS.1 [Saccharomyces cerevisiae]CAI4376858.1 AMH_1a_G0013600.mRNA.1.CDS.1 [Saccharomyces cerevisiae]CAI4385710.1 CEI_1a_G0013550.mRNA.1.CDS.1 [Saccharomyces cerevisiae]CAI6592280.1 AMH_1a_G0013600.mRNA.1.CDS.1 [Saccharomyces cerevisiae]